MASPKIKLSWATPLVDSAQWWVGLFAIHRRGHAAMPKLQGLSARAQKHFLQTTLHVSLRGVLLWLAGLCVTGYFVAAYVLYSAQNAQPHNRITYADVALPWRWSGLDALRGAALIEQARDEIKDGKYAAGFSRLRMGLDRNPTDSAARMELSQAYVLRRLRSHSDRVLLDAFVHGYPGRDYVEKSYRTLTYGDNPEKEIAFLEAAGKALTAAGETDEDRRLLDALLIETWLRTGREEAALQRARQLYAENSEERIAVELNAALAMKDYVRAEVWITRWRTLRPSSEEVLAKAAGVYRLAGRFDAMQACIDQLRKNSPLNSSLAAFNVAQNILAGRDGVARAALEDGLFRFGSDYRELALWSRDIAETGRDDFLERIEQFMTEHGHDLRSILFARLLAQIRSRDWTKAQATAVRMRERESRMKDAERLRVSVVTGLAVACADAGGGAQQVFIDAYQRSPFSLDYSRMMIEALLAADRPETAGQLITLAEGSYPESQYLKSAALRVRERLLVINKAQESARPVAEVSPAEKMQDASVFFLELKRLDASGEPDEALNLIRAVRKRAPVWLATNEPATTLRELDLSVRANDLTLLHLTVKNFLRGPIKDSHLILLQQAAGWRKAGLKTEPLMVVREILKGRPDFQPALDALEAWDPKPAPLVDAPH